MCVLHGPHSEKHLGHFRPQKLIRFYFMRHRATFIGMEHTPPLMLYLWTVPMFRTEVQKVGPSTGGSGALEQNKVSLIQAQLASHHISETHRRGMKKSESRSHDPSPRPHSDSVSVTGNRCAVTVIREPNKHPSQYKIEFSSPAAPTLSPLCYLVNWYTTWVSCLQSSNPPSLIICVSYFSKYSLQQ